MAKKKKSIKDIAKELGISITTVSFIINGKSKEKRISDELADKVNAYVKKVGYQPSHMAQSLRSGKSKVLVLMVEDISNQFFATIAKSIEEKAYKAGYKLIYCSTDNDPEKAKEMIDTFKNRGVDGLIITPTPHLEATIRQLIEEDFSVVLFDRWLPNIDCSQVGVENKKSAAEAILYLIRSGCKNIGFVTLASDQNQMQDRLDGYEEVIKQYNYTAHIFKLPFHHIASQDVKIKIQSFLKDNPELDAVLFTTNYLAFEGLEAIRTLDLKIPGDISVISFDDHYFFNLYQPKITAIAQPLEKIAERIMEKMLQSLEDEKISSGYEKIVLPNQLRIRDSTFFVADKV